jgi:UDP:flavonoid glycosyltransferase YjiC (YdhE family)
MSDVVIIGSPTAVGHVRPLLPLARRLLERGIDVVWAMSGDADDPASVWHEPMTDLGVRFVDVDQRARFDRVVTTSSFNIHGLRRRVLARANDVSAAATEAIRAAIGDRRIIAGVIDFFSLWCFIAMKRLGTPRIRTCISAFPMIGATGNDHETDDVYQAELAKLRADGLTADLFAGFMPKDPTTRMFAATSRRLCRGAHEAIHLLGVPREALPAASTIPREHEPLVARLRTARAAGTRVMLLSMGSLVIKWGARINSDFPAFVKMLYTTLAASALRAGALVIASTNDSPPEALGLDEATLGPAFHDRVIALPFVPQPLLFAHGLVDVMLMHGGANTFHETVLAGIPTLVCPVSGDQRDVARAVVATGVGVAIESPTMPDLPSSRPLDQVAADTLPALLAPDNEWKRSATRIAALVAAEDGVGAQLAFVLD